MSQCLEPGKQWRLNNSKLFLIFIFIILRIIRASLVVQTVKNLPEMQETSSIPGLGGSSGEGNGNPLQSSCLENPMDRGAWWATVNGVTKSQTGFRGWTYMCTSPPHTRREDNGLPYRIKHRRYSVSIEETRNSSWKALGILAHSPSWSDPTQQMCSIYFPLQFNLKAIMKPPSYTFSI